MKKYMHSRKVTVIGVIMAFIVWGLTAAAMAITTMVGLTVNRAYDPNMVIPSTGTFDFVKTAPSLPDVPHIDRMELEMRLRNSIIQTLSGKKYKLRADSNSPIDFYVRFGAAKKGIASLPFVSSVEIENQIWLKALYEVAALKSPVLVIDIVHPEISKVIWRGDAEAELIFGHEITEESQNYRTATLVQQLFELFPP